MTKLILFLSLAVTLVSANSYAQRMESMQRPLKPAQEKPKVEDNSTASDKQKKETQTKTDK